MATPAQPLAKCVLKWLYEQSLAVLKALRSFVERIISLIDAAILKVKAEIAATDPALVIGEFLWSKYEELINTIKNSLLSGIPGPGADVCPEFYSYLTDPAVALLEASLAAFTPYKERYLSLVSLSAQLDGILVYWEATKAQLLATLDVIDDAIYNVLIVEAANAVP